MSLLQNSNAIQTAGGYNINNSLRLRSSASAYLNRTPTTDGSDVTWTFSTWVKRGQLGVQQTILSTITNSGTGNFIGFLSDDTFSAFRLGATYQYRMITTQVFRDPSAWYHILEVYDSTQATASDRVKIYINGVQVTAFTTATYPALNVSAIGMNKTLEHRISRMYSGATYLDGYLTETYMVDGQALTPSDFGETDTTTGIWKPKAYTGTYGTNGFYLNFSDIATTSGSNAGLGKDFSGNGNYWTTNNISVTAGTTYDAMTDVPTNTSATVANYAVINPLATTGVTNVASNGNLRTNSTERRMYSSIGVSSGKWYFECTVVSVNIFFGIANDLSVQGTTLTGLLAYGNSGLKYNGATSSSYGASYVANDVIGVALDMDAGTLEFYKNNVSQGVAFTGLSGTYYASPYTGSAGAGFVNFGQQPFVYTPPTGYLAINTFNLPDSTIVKGNSYMDATLYTGNGSTQSITTASGFKPDLVWVKNRSIVSDNILANTVMGANLNLKSNTTAAEDGTSTYITAFNSNGFDVGSESRVNGNGNALVGWQWQAGQGSTSSNTNGTITSTVSANTTAGFSIVTYTGTGANATVGHGLGFEPSMIIVKGRSNVDNWQVYHSGLTSAAYRILLNSTAAQTSQPAVWNSTAPTSSVFSLGTGTSVNQSAQTFVAYCWAEIAGFSAFGSYTGNGSTNGPFVYTGFRPKFILLKNRGTAGYNWQIIDTSTNTSNVSSKGLEANTSATESTGSSTLMPFFDILSNGFKPRTTAVGGNASGSTYIYAAFAENPFKYSIAR